MRGSLLFLLLLAAFQPCQRHFPRELLQKPVTLSEPLKKRFPTTDRFLEATEQLFVLGLVLYYVVDTYHLLEDRFPKDWQEVCKASWLPLDCKEIRNPVTGKPILEWKKDDPGAIWLEQKDGALYLAVRYYDLEARPIGKVIVERGKVQLTGPSMRPEERAAIRKLPDGVKGAGLIAGLLFPILEADLCAHDATWEDITARYPVLKALRNPYTGEPLRPLFWKKGWKSPVQKGEPGTFGVLWKQDTRGGWSPDILVFVEDGEELTEYLNRIL